MSVAQKALMERLELHERLRRQGGDWLGAGRSYLQSHVPNGDRMIWGSHEPVHINGAQLEELMLKVAVAAVLEDRRHAAHRAKPSGE